MNNYQKQVYRTSLDTGVSPPTSIIASTVAIFNISEPTFAGAKTSNSSDTLTSSGTQNIGNAKVSVSEFQMGRLLAIFDTSAVTSLPIFGTLSFYVDSNPVSSSLIFRTVNPNVIFTPSSILTVDDWDSWNGSHDASGTGQASYTLLASATGSHFISLSPGQLTTINNNNQFSVFIVSNGDLGNIEPVNNSRPFFSAQSGLGISGIGDYRLTLTY